MRLCKPYRAQTKGKFESGVKSMRGNFWPAARFGEDADLNRQALAWCDEIANERVPGTTGRVPKAMLSIERNQLGALPERSSLSVYLREERKVGRDGYVNWNGSWYGVPWSWSGSTGAVGAMYGARVVEVDEIRLNMRDKSRPVGVVVDVGGRMLVRELAGSGFSTIWVGSSACMRRLECR